MITPYYQQELSHLKELAVEFAKANPALAPLLSGPSTDPDVERLLEGTAFLTGLLRQKLDDEFPELIHNLLQIIFPHYLRPVPSTVIMQFEPKPGLAEIMPVPAGTRLASVPVDGTKCLFTTCFDVEVQPLRVTAVSLEQRPGHTPGLTVALELTGLRLADWKAAKLRFLVAGAYPQAADRYALLMRHTSRLSIRPRDGGRETVLPLASLKPVGFGDDEALLPYPTNAFPGFRLLQEFFVLPHKFLFFEIGDLARFTDRGEGSRFELVFAMDRLPATLPEFKTEHLLLGATPAVNIFPHGAEPILLTHRKAQYRVRPSDMKTANYQVYAVTSVTGYAQGSVRQKKYVPFEMFKTASADEATYHVASRQSPLSEGMDQYLELVFPREAELAPETLSVELLCTNYRLPESLQIGDIREPTENSPELCRFTNISHPTATAQPPFGGNLLWRLLSHVSLNYLSLADVRSLKAMLELYIFPDSRDQAGIVANRKRVDGILEFAARESNLLLAGSVIRGHEIALTINSQHFASVGDMYLFSSILDYFLATYAGINCYCRCQVTDYNTGEKHTWPTRLGERRLL